MVTFINAHGWSIFAALMGFAVGQLSGVFLMFILERGKSRGE